jgi:hypothetical protein
MGKQADLRFASVRGLGRFRKRYGSSIVFPLVCAAIALLMLGPLVYHILTPGPIRGAAMADVLFSLVCAPLVFWLFWRRIREAVALYEGDSRATVKAGWCRCAGRTSAACTFHMLLSRRVERTRPSGIAIVWRQATIGS